MEKSWNHVVEFLWEPCSTDYKLMWLKWNTCTCFKLLQEKAENVHPCDFVTKEGNAVAQW